MTSALAEPQLVLKELAPGVLLHEGADTDKARLVLSDEAIQLVATLHRELQGERKALLAKREERQAAMTPPLDGEGRGGVKNPRTRRPPHP